MIELCVVADFPIMFQRLRRFVRTLMVQVKQNCRITYLLGFNSHIKEPLSKFPVLSAVMHLLIIAVDGKHICSPSGCIASIPCCLCGSDKIHELAESGTLYQLGTLKVPLEPLRPEPFVPEGVARFYICAAEPLADIHRES